MKQKYEAKTRTMQMSMPPGAGAGRNQCPLAAPPAQATNSPRAAKERLLTHVLREIGGGGGGGCHQASRLNQSFKRQGPCERKH